MKGGGTSTGVLAVAFVLAVVACEPTGDENTSTTTQSAADTTATTTSAPARLVYATREGDQVTVFRRPLAPGDPERIFDYAERAWDEPPQAAVSSDGRLVAYIVGAEDLRVRDVGSGKDRLVVSGDARPAPPRADASPPRWSVGEMNVNAAEQAQCPECGILSISQPMFSPSGRWVAFLQAYYEGSNWGFVELATGRYETSGDAAGALSWADDRTIVTVGAFYGELGSVRRATLDQLPSSSTVDTGGGERRDHRSGVVSPDGKILAVAFSEPSDRVDNRQARLGRMFTSGSTLEAVDADGEKLAVGFDDRNQLVWIEQSAGSAAFLREGIQAGPLPDDLSVFHRITPVGSGLVGAAGERTTSCDPPPCQGRPAPFEQRYLVIDLDGRVVWQSPAYGRTTGFAGIVR